MTTSAVAAGPMSWIDDNSKYRTRTVRSRCGNGQSKAGCRRAAPHPFARNALHRLSVCDGFNRTVF